MVGQAFRYACISFSNGSSWAVVNLWWPLLCCPVSGDVGAEAADGAMEPDSAGFEVWDAGCLLAITSSLTAHRVLEKPLLTCRMHQMLSDHL